MTDKYMAGSLHWKTMCPGGKKKTRGEHWLHDRVVASWLLKSTLKVNPEYYSANIYCFSLNYLVPISFELSFTNKSTFNIRWQGQR